MGIKWADLDGFDVKTWLCHLTSWVAWDKLLYQSELLSLSVFICKMELVIITLLVLGMMSGKFVSIVSTIEEIPNNNISYLSYQAELEYR